MPKIFNFEGVLQQNGSCVITTENISEHAEICISNDETETMPEHATIQILMDAVDEEQNLKDHLTEYINSHAEIYVGDGEMPENATIQFITSGSDGEQAWKNELSEYIAGEIEKAIPTIVDSVIAKLGPVLGSCSFTRNFIHCSFDDVSQNFIAGIYKGASFSGNISADEGYALPCINVTMGGVDITSDVVDGGSINIPCVTGDIVITANVYNFNSQLISCFFVNPTLDNARESAIVVGSAFSTEVWAADGYTMNQLEVYMDGLDITSDVVAGGSINIPCVTGDIIIIATASADGSYDI